MAGKLFKTIFPGAAIKSSGIMLRSYSAELSEVQSQAQVSNRFGNRGATLPLYLTIGSSPTLLRRNWICALGIQLLEGHVQEAALHGVQDIPSFLSVSITVEARGGQIHRGMRHVAVYSNDILVTGIDDGDHMQNLHNVLARLPEAGFGKSAYSWFLVWNTGDRSSPRPA
ncbi:hypothetical protein MRX96_020420 [Rhipicephalus microplus]